MLSRVRRLEASHVAPISPFARAYGTFPAFEADIWADVQAGKLDRMDWLGADGNGGLLASIRRWETDGTWGAWHRNRVREIGR